jgi:hypothetical protein
MNYVIVHDEYGIFVGCALGLAFWSKMDSAGQPCVCTFATEDDAHQFLDRIVSLEDIPDCKILPVNCEGPWADIAILKEAGLGEFLGDMEADALRYAEAAGTA